MKIIGAMPMGPQGDYTFMGQNVTVLIGAMMNADEKDTTPFWNFAFTVTDIDAVKAAVENGGGPVTHGPINLSRDQGDWLIQANEPQSAKV